MRWSFGRRLLAVLTVSAWIGVPVAPAQTPVTAPPPGVPTDSAPSAPSASDDDVEWLGLGATAECRDGSFFHGKPDPHACVEHGGVRQWLQVQGQDLIR